MPGNDRRHVSGERPFSGGHSPGPAQLLGILIEGGSTEATERVDEVLGVGDRQGALRQAAGFYRPRLTVGQELG